METIIIAERKRKCIGELIFLAILLTGIMICLLSDSLFFIIFIVFLVVPAMGIVQCLWNVPSKIELSKEQIVISYGRSILENEESGGSFSFPSILKLKWENITDFNIRSFKYDSYRGDDAGTVTVHYKYLTITGTNIDNLNPNTSRKYTLVVNRFEKTPEEILAICKQFQSEYGQLMED